MTPGSSDISILHATPHFTVIHKPQALLSVPGKGPDKARCAASRVRDLFPDATGPLVVHRLDMDTSGLMVFALTPDSQRNLSRQFERRQVSKRYIALLDGLLTSPQGLITAPIRLDPRARPFQIHDPHLGQPAQTRYSVLAYETDRTRVLLEPITGRTHQLRVHAALPPPAGLGHHILGDPLYSPAGQSIYHALLNNQPPPSYTPDSRLMLHASYLRFHDPITNTPLEFTSTPDF